MGGTARPTQASSAGLFRGESETSPQRRRPTPRRDWDLSEKQRAASPKPERLGFGRGNEGTGLGDYPSRHLAPPNCYPKNYCAGSTPRGHPSHLLTCRGIHQKDTQRAKREGQGIHPSDTCKIKRKGSVQYNRI